MVVGSKSSSLVSVSCNVSYGFTLYITHISLKVTLTFRVETSEMKGHWFEIAPWSAERKSPCEFRMSTL